MGSVLIEFIGVDFYTRVKNSTVDAGNDHRVALVFLRRSSDRMQCFPVAKERKSLRLDIPPK